MKKEPGDAIAEIWRDDLVARLYVMELTAADDGFVATLLGVPQVAASRKPFLFPKRFLAKALEAHRWPRWALLDASSSPRRPLVRAPNAIVLLVGDNTREAEIRRAFDEALAYLKRQQRRHDGRPRLRPRRVDYRLERAALFLWLNATTQFGRPLGAERISRLWLNLTRTWQEHRGAAATGNAPASLRLLPQADRAWCEWDVVHRLDDGVEDFDRDAVRAILHSVEPLGRARGRSVEVIGKKSASRPPQVRPTPTLLAIYQQAKRVRPAQSDPARRRGVGGRR